MVQVQPERGAGGRKWEWRKQLIVTPHLARTAKWLSLEIRFCKTGRKKLAEWRDDTQVHMNLGAWIKSPILNRHFIGNYVGKSDFY